MLTQEQTEQYRTQGFCVLERCLSAEDLESLRAECARFIREIEAEMDAQDVDVLDLSHRNKRYFIGGRSRESPVQRAFLFGDLMAEITRAVLGDDVYLFNEQYVVKSADVGMSFGWHQDSGYIGHRHRPYLSCWCALDGMTEENGTVYVLPYDRAGTREMVPHERQEGTNDLVGYDGEDPGIPAIVPAGSIVLFSSCTFHRSAANTTPNMRRVYLAQYSAEPILNREGTRLWNLAEPLWKGARGRVLG